MIATPNLRVRRTPTAAQKAGATVRGLPGPLPEGERLLWQGSPDWRTLRRQAFHVRGVCVYFALILAWCLATQISAGAAASSIAASMARLTVLALVPVGLINLYCWALQRSTLYTITSRRVAISFGLVVPTTLNLPFERIAAAGLRVNKDGTGDIPMTLLASEKLAYLLAWPHARPWRMARAEPMLRGIPDAASVASVLGRALAAEAAMQPVSIKTQSVSGSQERFGQMVGQAA